MKLVGSIAASLALAALVNASAATAETRVATESHPIAVADSLLFADRAFAAAAANTDMVSAISAMLDTDIVMPLPDGKFARGTAEAAQALRANPENATSRVEWAPVRGGVSADGQHGFTFGYMTVRRASGAAVPGKYLAYWVRRPNGWRVLAYKRAPRPAEGVTTPSLAPSLPARLAAPITDAAAIAAYRKSVVDAERAFSDEAQKIGVGPAFAKHGHADAMNMGAGAAFTIGSGNIARELFAETKGSPIHWSADGSAAASSGDLGVTWGLIRPHAAPPAGQPAASAFFTIWRRDSPSEPWRYIAE